MATATPSSVARGKPTSVGARAFILFSLFAQLIFPVHEFAHYLAYRVLGAHLQMTLNTASPSDQSQRAPIAELAGPLLNLFVATVAAMAYLSGHRRRQWLAELALAAALMRLVVYVLVVGAALVTGSGLSLGNDEPIAASLWGLPSLTFVALFAIPFLCIVGVIVRTFQENRLRKAVHILGRSLAMVCIGILMGTILDPWLFPNRYA